MWLERVSDGECYEIARALAPGQARNLQLLHISGSVGDTSGAGLADALADGGAPQLRELQLSRHALSDLCAEALARAIRYGQLQALEMLNLDHNDIGDVGAHPSVSFHTPRRARRSPQSSTRAATPSPLPPHSIAQRLAMRFLGVRREFHAHVILLNATRIYAAHPNGAPTPMATRRVAAQRITTQARRGETRHTGGDVRRPTMQPDSTQRGVIRDMRGASPQHTTLSIGR